MKFLGQPFRRTTRRITNNQPERNHPMNSLHFTRALAVASSVIMAVGLAVSPAAVAEDAHDHGPTVTEAGTVRCTSCDLKKQQHAKAQCSVYGCQFAFKADRVTDADGKAAKNLEGKTYQIMLNDQSKALAAKEQKGGKFTLQARIYADDGVIEVLSFQAEKK
jgi:hypothetical protein